MGIPSPAKGLFTDNLNQEFVYPKAKEIYIRRNAEPINLLWNTLGQ